MELNHNCYECGFTGWIKVKRRKVTCPSCSTQNDIWIKGELPPANHRQEHLTNRE